MNYEPINEVDFTKPPKLDYLFSLTDNRGILQHTKRETLSLAYGYSIDDQARALLVVSKYQNFFGPTPKLKMLKKIYLDYIDKAKSKGGLFNNFISSEGIFDTGENSEDNVGRVVWSLGYLITHESDNVIKEKAKEIIKYSSSYIDHLDYVKSKSYSLIGLSHINLSNNPKPSLQEKLVVLEKEIIKSFQQFGHYSWFEDCLTYANAIIPCSLLHSYEVTKNSEALRVALQSLDFLDKVCVLYPHLGGVYPATSEVLRSDSSEVNYFPGPIGNKGWYARGGKKAIYDQQVIDVADMILAHAQAYKITKNSEHLDKALWWFDWFYGNNINSMKMVDEESGAVFDGLTIEGRNENRGAESLVCYLLAYLELSHIYSRT